MRLIAPRCGSPVRGSVMYFFQFIGIDFKSGTVYLSSLHENRRTNSLRSK